MTELFDAAKTFLSSLSTDQLVALFIGVMALSCAVKFLKDTLSTIVSVLGVLFILYFFAPGLYADLIAMLIRHSAGLVVSLQDFRAIDLKDAPGQPGASFLPLFRITFSAPARSKCHRST